jgi:diketogulonate reductase-like aldo/keto reductase
MTVPLGDGVSIPQVGFGVYLVPPAQTEAAVRTALDAGYRSIDTAAMYGNEREVGRAIRGAQIPRDAVFVTTKLNNPDHGYDSALRAFDASLAALGMNRLDLYLIHWPQPRRNRYVETWRALIRLKSDGRVRAIGVANFQPAHLERLLAETGVLPAINQVELHPYLAQPRLRAFHAEHGIVTEAWGRWHVAVRCCGTPCSPASPPSTAGRRLRWCCAGTCSSGMWSSPSQSRQRG